MSAHTPGPWVVSGLDPHVAGPMRILILAGAAVPQLQAVARIVDRGPEAEPNARLIAAAPELLAALRDAVAALGGIHSDHVSDSVRAAIAKADGAA